jgi:hypothetical protein
MGGLRAAKSAGAKEAQSQEAHPLIISMRQDLNFLNSPYVKITSLKSAHFLESNGPHIIAQSQNAHHIEKHLNFADLVSDRRTMAHWFVDSNTQIEGPYTTEMILSRIHAGQLQPTDQIWGRVLEDWRPISWWQSSLDELSLKAIQISNPEIWHYAYDGSTYGPLAWGDLVHNLKSIRSTSLEQLSAILIWTKGMKDWAPVLEFHEIMEELGVSKREYARAEITSGEATVKSQGNVFRAPLKTVSEGGFGMASVPGLIAGEMVVVELNSPELRDTIHAKAEVRYVTDRVVGFKFTQVNIESKNQLIHYVKKMGKNLFMKTAA